MAKLTEIQLKKLKPKDKPFRLSDGNGLSLLVSPYSMSWQYRYHIKKGDKRVEKIYTIPGGYPAISIAQARTEHALLRAQVVRGIDIQAEKINKRKIKPVIKESFKDVAYEWLDMRKTKNLSETTWNKDWSRLERFVFNKFGDMKLEDITAHELRKHLVKVAEVGEIDSRGMKIGGRETAMRTMNAVSSVLKYAMVLGKVKNNVALGLTEYLPSPKMIHRKAMLDEVQLGKYIYTVENADNSRDLVGCALRLLPHIFCRHSELLGMKWKEINFKKKEWNYDVSKTKKTGVKKQKVFLSDQAIKILEDCKKLSGDEEKVFQGNTRKGELSQRATLYRMRELGFSRDELHPHGFRATARSLGVDELKYESRVIELCLAHKTKEILGEAYDRSERFEDRRNFMNDWSDFLIDCKTKYQKSSIKVIK
jgi:integrase